MRKRLLPPAVCATVAVAARWIVVRLPARRVIPVRVARGAPAALLLTATPSVVIAAPRSISITTARFTFTHAFPADTAVRPGQSALSSELEGHHVLELGQRGEAAGFGLP